MTSELVQGIESAYRKRGDLLVFALTGRTGSGCSTAASTLARPLSDLALSEEDFPETERRKLGIVLEYARKNWTPFTAITVSSVIYSFLLDESWTNVSAFLERRGIPPIQISEFDEHLQVLRSDPSYYSYRKAVSRQSSPAEMATAWHFFTHAISPRALQTRRVLSEHFPPLFQTFGDNIRYSGAPLNSEIRPAYLFALMDRVLRLIRCAATFQSERLGQPARVVLDAIRNPLELLYLRRYLPSLYVAAVTTDDGTRRSRLVEQGFGKKEIDALDDKEYNKRRYLTDYSSFVSQNLRECIQRSDIFVANPGDPSQSASTVRFMNAQLVRYVALALRPGLVTPTRDERCMQVAFVAKLNSGCISRQVGAAVADGNYAIHSLGWNDVPKGQTPCLLRDVSSLLTGKDDDSFSDFEKSDKKLRIHLEKKFAHREALRTENGLRCPFCFKDAYNETTSKDNQVHTRSLHAEENAFLQLARRGNPGIAHGVLYTTASPCELCSKKAYQLGIMEIVYVDPYPGISMSHVLKSGPVEARPRLRLYSGAVGPAYHRLYEAILPVKDEYSALLQHGYGQSAGSESDGDDSKGVTLDLWDDLT